MTLVLGVGAPLDAGALSARALDVGSARTGAPSAREPDVGSAPASAISAVCCGATAGDAAQPSELDEAKKAINATATTPPSTTRRRVTKPRVSIHRGEYASLQSSAATRCLQEYALVLHHEPSLIRVAYKDSFRPALGAEKRLMGQASGTRIAVQTRRTYRSDVWIRAPDFAAVRMI